MRGEDFLKVAIDGRMISYTGIGRYIQNLVANLPVIDAENSFSVVSNDARPSTQVSPPNLEYQKTMIHIPVYSLREQSLLPVEMGRTGADLLHYPSFNMPLFNSRPAVVTIHDLIYYLHPEACPNRLAHMYARFIFKTISGRVRRIITVSEFSRDEIVEHLGIDPVKVAVVYNSVSPVYAPVEDEERLDRARKHYGIDGDYVFYVGNHQPRKNLERLVEAFASLVGKTGHLLVIAGKVDPRRSGLYAMAEEARFKGRVRFIGRVDDEYLPALYTMATMLVFPSLLEGFGFPPLEAMACGTPVLTSNAASLPEVVGGAGITVEPTSVDEIAGGMERLLSDPVLRAELSAKGLERSKAFGEREAAEKTLSVYRDALEA